MPFSRVMQDLGSAALGVMLLLATARAQEVSRVSVDSAGAQSNGKSSAAVLSTDGQVVAFRSDADNLVAGDINLASDVFVHDRASGVTECVSVDSAGIPADDDSDEPALSADGQVVAFSSRATNVVAGDTNGVWDIFVHDRKTGITGRVSVDSAGAEGNKDSRGPALSADGQLVAFWSDADNLVAGDTNRASDIFVHDRGTGITQRVSVPVAGQANSISYDPVLSADGQVVAFNSRATNLVANDNNGWDDIFVYDQKTGITELVSVDSSGVQANKRSFDPALSADGQVAAFRSSADNLVTGDVNGWDDVFVHVRSSGITELASVDSSGVQADDASFAPALSADGQVVAFWSAADNLVAINTSGVGSVFLRDRLAATTILASVNCAGASGDADSRVPSLSGDGRIVAFESSAKILIVGDTNQAEDCFVNDFTVLPFDAFWTNYGTGYAGSLGVPTLVASADPVFGTTISIDASNSSGIWTVGFLVVGLDTASIPTSAGGTLLVDPLVFFLFGLAPNGAPIPAHVPRDVGLCGVSIDLQALELDPGAPKGISFTPGLELAFGN